MLVNVVILWENGYRSFFFFISLWGGTWPRHVPVLRAASLAGPVHSPRGKASVYCCESPSGWPDSVCVKCSVVLHLFSYWTPPASLLAAGQEPTRERGMYKGGGREVEIPYATGGLAL